MPCRLRGIKLGNFEFCDNQLQLGQLKGNAFRILMRDVDPQDEQHVSNICLVVTLCTGAAAAACGPAQVRACTLPHISVARDPWALLQDQRKSICRLGLSCMSSSPYHQAPTSWHLHLHLLLTPMPDRAVCCAASGVLLQIASAVSEVREKGFINYFGLQRFGTGNVPTHRWAQGKPWHGCGPATNLLHTWPQHCVCRLGC